MFKKLSVLAVLVGSSFGVAHAGSQTFDARAMGMGGVGVSTADYLSAAFHNPALVSRYGDDDDIGILLPYVGISAQDPDNIVEQLEDFSDVYDNLDPTSSPSDAETVANDLKELSGDQAFVQLGVGLAVAIPNQYLSTSLFAKGYADAFVLADVDSDDTETSSYLDPSYELGSKGRTFGVAIVEVGVALSKSFETSHGTYYAGVTPKYQRVNTINYSVGIDDYEFDDIDDDSYRNEKSGFNADIGFAYAMDQGFTFGFVAKNIIEEEYETTISRNAKAVYVINPVYTVSSSYTNDFVTVGVDLELNETERYKNFTGLESDLDSSSDNTQIVGVGAEFNAWNWAQIRVGYQHDIAGTIDDQLTAGLGLSPFDILHIDVAGTYAGEDQLGVAIQTSLTF